MFLFPALRPFPMRKKCHGGVKILDDHLILELCPLYLLLHFTYGILFEMNLMPSPKIAQALKMMIIMSLAINWSHLLTSLTQCGHQKIQNHNHDANGI